MSDVELQKQIDKLKTKLDDLATRERALGQPFGIPIFVPDAMVCDYDGLQPYALDIMGSPNGNLGQPATVPAATLLGNVVYRKGLFGKAIQLSRATTNLIPNPSFEKETGTTITGWTRVTSGTITGFIGAVEATPYSVLGHNAYHIKQTTLIGSIYIYAALGALTGAYTVSFDVEVISGTVAVRVDNSTTFPIAGAFLEITESGRYSITFTGNGTAHNLLIMAGSNINALGLGEGYFDCVQLESGAYASPYADGSMGSGYAWSGTANNSSSTRKNSMLYYPANIVGRGGLQGTMMAWMQLGPNPTRAVFDARSAGLTGTWVVYTASGFINWRDGSPADLIHVAQPAVVGLNEWHHIALTWDYVAGEFYLYWDGELIGSYVGAVAFTTIGQFNVGCGYDATFPIDGLVANLVVSSRVLSADAFRAVYQSNAPAYSSNKFDFDIWQNVELATTAKVLLFPENTAFSGEILIVNLNNRETAKFLAGSSSGCNLISDTGSSFSATIGTASKLNVGWDTGGISVQNNSAATVPFAILTRRMPVQGLAHTT